MAPQILTEGAEATANRLLPNTPRQYSQLQDEAYVPPR